MKKKLTVLRYFLLINLVFIIDRVTKNLAMFFEGTPKNVLPGMACVYVKNRGISWGMFNSQSSWAFFVIILFVAMVIGMLGVYTYKRWLQSRSVTGEILVLTGATSNLIDRIVHCGVIDFIELSYNGWYFPVFNIADVAIVLGVGMMLIALWREA